MLADNFRPVFNCIVIVACPHFRNAFPITTFYFIYFNHSVDKAPGEGPSKEVRDTGFFWINYVARGDVDGKEVVCRGKVGSDKGDFGYSETAKVGGGGGGRECEPRSFFFYTLSSCAYLLVLLERAFAKYDGILIVQTGVVVRIMIMVRTFFFFFNV